MAIAFFDLDKTLLSKNSGMLWVRSELKQGFISWWQALRAWVWLTRYHLGFARLEEAMLQSIASLAGVPEAMVRERADALYQAQVANLIRPGAHAALEGHRAAGDALLLLTSSSNHFSEAITMQLNLDGFLCNRLEVDALGNFTGRHIGTLCYGPGKVEVATRFADQHGTALADCTFYSDSCSDLPMLEAVGRPVAVNPDLRLKRIASRRGWEIADWGEPSWP